MRRRGPILAVAVLLFGGACSDHSRGPAEPEEAAAPESASAPAEDFSCKLPAMPDHGYCPYGPMMFYAQFEQALDETVALRPDLFDLDDVHWCDKCYKIKDGHEFYRVFISRLERMGLCAKCDEECGIKNTNAFNEQYDVIVWQGYIRRGIGAYRGTCFPSAF